jgi:hypothetical protein
MKQKASAGTVGRHFVIHHDRAQTQNHATVFARPDMSFEDNPERTMIFMTAPF